MSSSVAIRARLPQPPGMSITPSQWRVLTDAIFPSAKTPEAIALALDYCAARKLDPFKRSVHIVPMWNKSLRREVETIWPGINELQVTAARTGQWGGMDEPKWGPVKKRVFKAQTEDGERTLTLEFPEWCSVTVYRLIGGQKYPFTEPVYWEESYGRTGRSEIPNDMWQKRSRGQLHKNAKAASLRAAFPEEMGNDYTSEEMEGKEIEHGGVVIDGHAESARRIDDTLPDRLFNEPDPAPDDVEFSWLEQLDAKLHQEPNGTKWLKLFDAELANVPTREDAEGAAGLSSVAKAYEAAPSMIKERINEILRKAVAKFDQASTVQNDPDFMSAETENV